MKLGFSLPRIVVVIAALYGSSSTFAAPVVIPDAGSTLRELETAPEVIEPRATEPIKIEGEAPISETPTAEDATLIPVKAIRITGATAFPVAQLDALVADLIGADHPLSKLKAAVTRISTFYRQHGYIVARAYLPAQDITDGLVTIAVQEGRIDKVSIANQSRISDQRAADYLATLKPGDLIAAEPVDYALLLLNETPGVGTARATLQPGASVGTSELLISLDPGTAYSGSVEIDNYGGRYTGENRIGAGLNLNSPFNMGDLFTVRGLTSGAGLTYGRVSWQTPVGASGLKLGAAYVDTSYALGKDFVLLKAHGTATTGSLFATYPLIRSQTASLSGTLTWEDKKLNDRIDAASLVTDKHVQLTSLGLSGTFRDTGGISTVTGTLTSGNLSIATPSVLAIDAASARTHGSYTKILLNGSRLQSLTAIDMAYLAVSTQQTFKNLDSSEKFSLGGSSGVRAYSSGEASGDEGWMANLEWRHNLAENIQSVLFYDIGSVRINHRAYAAGPNTKNLSGLGVGINATILGLQITSALAWQAGAYQSTSDITRHPRAWLQVTKEF